MILISQGNKMLNFIRKIFSNKKTKNNDTKKVLFINLKKSFLLSKEYTDNINRLKDGGQVYVTHYETFLHKTMQPILDNNKLTIVDEDYMGALAYSIYNGNKKIGEFFSSDQYYRMEEVYWYVTNNFK